MEFSFKVIRTVNLKNSESTPKVIAEFVNLDDAFYWIKYINKYRNKTGKCNYYLDCIDKVVNVNSLPASYKEMKK